MNFDFDLLKIYYCWT